MREEIEAVLGEKEYPDFDDLNQFHYCKNVLHETLRMRPPAPALDRRTVVPLTVDGIDIPVGVNIYFFTLFWFNPNCIFPLDLCGSSHPCCTL